MEDKKYSLNEINPYALLATHLGLKPVVNTKSLFLDKNGNKWFCTEYGFVPNEVFSKEILLKDTKNLLIKTQDELKLIKEKYHALRKEYALIEKESKAVALLKMDLLNNHSKGDIRSILESQMSNEDKLTNISNRLGKKKLI